MDRALDEVISEKQRASNSNRGGRNIRRRDNYRDSNTKTDRDTANLDDEWIHDKYDEDDDGSRRPSRRSRPGRYERASPEDETIARERDRGHKIRVENLHWDLNETDLKGLFERIGPISRLSIDYDRAGRSTGTAYVTYPDALDARDAVRQFDGANAKGQPIRLTMVPSGPNSRGHKNPLDNIQRPGKSLFDRIGGSRENSSQNRNQDRNRSRSPGRKRADLRASARDDIDRYVPSDRSRSRSRSPRRRNDNRTGSDRNSRPRGGRERRNPRADDQGHGTVNGRPRMTQEELDRDMENYFSSAKMNGTGDNANAAPSANAPSTTAGFASIDTGAGALVEDDIDMIE